MQKWCCACLVNKNRQGSIPCIGSMLTYEEQAMVETLGYLYQDFSVMVGDGASRVDDMREIAFHIHALQNMILAQSAAREYPSKFRLMGGVIES